MFTVRRVGPEEGLVIRALRLAAISDSPAAFGATYAGEVSIPLAEYEAIGRQRATSDSGANFLAVERDRFVGIIGGYFEETTGRPQIASMWVAPEHRRSGVGRALVEAATDWLRGLGAREINAWVTTTNQPATRFYESLGFVPTDTVGALASNPALTERLHVRPLSPGPALP